MKTLLILVATIACLAPSIEGGPMWDSHAGVIRSLAKNYHQMEEHNQPNENELIQTSLSALDLDNCDESLRARLLQTPGGSAKLERAVDACSGQLERKLERTFNESLAGDQDILRLVGYLAPGFQTLELDVSSPSGRVEDLEPDWWPSAIDDRLDILNKSQLGRVAIDLGLHDPEASLYEDRAHGQTGSRHLAVSGRNFQRALDKYLLEPCAKFRSIVGADLSLARLFAGAKLHPMDFMVGRSALFKRLAWTDKLCKMVQATGRQSIIVAWLNESQVNV